MICLRTLIFRIRLVELARCLHLVFNLAVGILLYLQALRDHDIHAHVLLHLLFLVLLIFLLLVALGLKICLIILTIKLPSNFILGLFLSKVQNLGVLHNSWWFLDLADLSILMVINSIVAREDLSRDHSVACNEARSRCHFKRLVLNISVLLCLRYFLVLRNSLFGRMISRHLMLFTLIKLLTNCDLVISNSRHLQLRLLVANDSEWCDDYLRLRLTLWELISLVLLLALLQAIIVRRLKRMNN